MALRYVAQCNWRRANLCRRMVAEQRGSALNQAHDDTSRTETGIVTFLCSLANAAAKIIISIMALSQLGVPVGPMITAIGAAGVTVGLALKENMTNIASGAQIVFTKPFAVGDYLLVDNVEGTVERIEMMFTTLRTFDNKEIVIPNSTITVSTIINYTAMKTRRLDLRYSWDTKTIFQK